MGEGHEEGGNFQKNDGHAERTLAMRLLIATFLLWCSPALGQDMFAPFILTADSAPVAWSKLGSSTTIEMPMYQNSYAFNYTVTAGADLLTVSIASYDAGGVSAITFNGDAMTKAADTYTSYVENFRAQVWYLSNPDVGTYSVSMTFSQQITNLVAGASHFDGIAVSSPVRDTGLNGGSSTSPSASVDAAQSGDLIIGAVVANGGTLSTADTEDWEEYHNADNMIGGGIRKLATGAAMTTSWTSGNVDWYAICVAFKLQ